MSSIECKSLHLSLTPDEPCSTYKFLHIFSACMLVHPEAYLFHILRELSKDCIKCILTKLFNSTRVECDLALRLNRSLRCVCMSLGIPKLYYSSIQFSLPNTIAGHELLYPLITDTVNNPWATGT